MKGLLRNPIRPRAFTRAIPAHFVPIFHPPDFRLEFTANREHKGIWMLSCPQMKCCFPTKDLFETIRGLVEEAEGYWEE